MDGLSAAASVIAVVQLTEEVIKLCYHYAITAKNARRDICDLSSEVQTLQGVLEDVEGLSRRPEADGNFSALRRLGVAGGTFDRCSDALRDLKSGLELPERDGKLDRLITALRWPLKSKETDKAASEIRGYRDTIHLALSGDHASVP